MVYKNKYDVIVVGGGPGGFPAAIAAARRGKSVLLIERNAYLGGLLSAGIPPLAYKDRAGNTVVAGIAQELVDRISAYGAASEHMMVPIQNCMTMLNAAWVRLQTLEMCVQAGVHVMFYADVFNVCVDGDRVTGIDVLCKGEKLHFDAEITIWLGENVEISGSVRSMALTTEEDTAALYLWDSRGLINHFSTALPSSAVEELALTFAPNGGSFGFESGFDGLAPYTILVSEPASVRAAWSALPDGYSAYNLLAALEFNPHTNSRYFESSGTEVVEVPSGSVRISQDGTTHYSGEPENASALFRPAIAGQQATAVEALDAARKLAAALSAGTNASPLYLADMSGSAGSWRITFRYQVDGIPVLMSSGEDALTVSMEGNAITAFAYYCRTYTGAEETATLLPPTMAAAIAAQKSGSGLSLCYVDSGAEVSARWVAQ